MKSQILYSTHDRRAPHGRTARTTQFTAILQKTPNSDFHSACQSEIDVIQSIYEMQIP